MADIRVKRIYRAGRVSDGARVLVDRLWPRGMEKHRARLHNWARDVAPSDGLRRWFHAHLDDWAEFERRYRAELAEVPDAVQALVALARQGPLTLLFASKDEERNNATVLRAVLLEHLAEGESP